MPPREHPPEVLRSMETLLALWDELRSRPGPYQLVLRGSSMWPAAPEGSLLEVTPCPIDALAVGDMVTFKLGSRVITHRVHQLLAGGKVQTWGDSLLDPDPPLSDADILGRAEVLRRGPLFKSRPRLRLMLRRAVAAMARRRS